MKALGVLLLAVAVGLALAAWRAPANVMALATAAGLCG